MHFVQPTSLALRENNPDGKSGMESLKLLGVGGGSKGAHERKGSTATTASFSPTESGDTDDGMGLKIPELSISEGTSALIHNLS